MKKENTRQVIDEALSKLTRKYGDGTVMRMGEAPTQSRDGISTGSIGLDLATGCSGYPRGRGVEIYGPESSGKTTLTLHAISNCQAKGGVAAFVDAEHALDPAYAQALGVDLNELIISQPDHGEQALDVVSELVSSGGIQVLALSSPSSSTSLGEMPMSSNGTVLKGRRLMPLDIIVSIGGQSVRALSDLDPVMESRKVRVHGISTKVQRQQQVSGQRDTTVYGAHRMSGKQPGGGRAHRQ